MIDTMKERLGNLKDTSNSYQREPRENVEMAIFKEILASKIEKDIRSQNKEGS